MDINKLVEQTLAEKAANQMAKDNTVQLIQKSKETTSKKKKQTSENTDKISLSIEGKELYKYNSTYQKAKNDERIIKKHEEQRRQAIEKAKKEKQSSSYFAKMMEIARRIARGDKVPPDDERRLREYNNELYLTVKSMALMNKKPEEYDSLFGKDRQDNVAIENEEETQSPLDTVGDILSEAEGGESIE